MTRRFTGVTLSVTLAIAVSACGGGGGGGGGADPAPVGREVANPKADQLCRKYRATVTEVHYKGSRKQVAKDIAKVSKAARAILDGTNASQLGSDGSKFLSKLDAAVPLYVQAAAAERSGDPGSFKRAVAKARSADAEIDRYAESSGLRYCPLGAAESGEKRASAPGFPSMVVPEAAASAKPSKGGASVAYPLSDREAILVSRGPKTRYGRTALAYATYFYRRSSPDAARAKKAGKIGRQPVPIQGYDFTGSKLRGMTYVFSGQGNLWVMFCATKGKKTSGELKKACSRAVRTVGFLMF